MGTFPFCHILLRQTEVVGRQRDRDLSGDEVHGTHGNKGQTGGQGLVWHNGI